MYGHPQAPQVPQPPKSPVSGGRIALLVVFSLLSLLSCGFLAWAPLLRLAVVTRRQRDWVLCGLTFLGAAGLFAYAAATGDKETTTGESFAAVGVMIVLVAGSITYYLIGELRHLEHARVAAPYVPQGYAYGAGGGAVTVPRPDVRPNPYIAPVTPPPVVPAPATPVPQPPGPRIDQVRAELDELSDLLRREPRDGEGGR